MQFKGQIKEMFVLKDRTPVTVKLLIEAEGKEWAGGFEHTHRCDITIFASISAVKKYTLGDIFDIDIKLSEVQ